jgi:hypothetical protein
MSEKINFERNINPEGDKFAFRKNLADQERKLEEAKSSAGRWLARAIKRTGERSIQD